MTTNHGLELLGKRALRSFAYGSVAVLVSMLAVIVGGAFQRLFRFQSSASFFWIFNILVGVALLRYLTPLLAILVFSTAVCAGMYSELEKRGLFGFWIAALAVVLATTCGVAAPFLAGFLMNVDFLDQMQIALASQIVELNKNPLIASMHLDAQTILALTPGTLAGLHATTLAVGLSLEKRIAIALDAKINRPALQLRLLEFRTPDLFVWLSLLAAAASFAGLKTPVGVVGANFLILAAVVFFFQGLAISEVAFLVFRVGFLARLLFYLLLVGNLPFVLIGVGFADFWINMRLKMRSFATRSKEK